jgi:putative transposase
MAEAVGAEKGELAEGRLSHRSGYYPRSLITRVGKLELRVPQDRNGRFSTEIFERYQRREKALVAALTQMSAPELCPFGAPAAATSPGRGL